MRMAKLAYYCLLTSEIRLGTCINTLQGVQGKVTTNVCGNLMSGRVFSKGRGRLSSGFSKRRVTNIRLRFLSVLFYHYHNDQGDRLEINRGGCCLVMVHEALEAMVWLSSTMNF